MKLSLPRIYNRGPPPIMVINSNVRNILDLRNYSYSENIPKTILTELYINRKLSQQKIANVFNVQHDTVRRWLDRLDIPVRVRETPSHLLLQDIIRVRFLEIYRKKHTCWD